MRVTAALDCGSVLTGGGVDERTSEPRTSASAAAGDGVLEWTAASRTNTCPVAGGSAAERTVAARIVGSATAAGSVADGIACAPEGSGCGVADRLMEFRAYADADD